MINSKMKTATILITFVLIIPLLLSGSITVSAADVETRFFMSVNPNPVGVGQFLSITLWSPTPLPTPFGSFIQAYSDLMITITKPDATTATIGPLTSNEAGITFTSYTPTQIGTYTFQAEYPGQTMLSGATYLPDITPITEVTVQEDPISYRSGSELPTGYWERPINPENREWSTISGNWLMHTYNSTYHAFDGVGAFNPYSQAPRAPHIMWTKEVGLGGIIGGEFNSMSYYTGRSYENFLTPPIIMNGRLYYNTHSPSLLGASAYLGVVCVDLRTGEELWRNDEANIDVGQIFNYMSGNQFGGLPFLWGFNGGSYEVYDPITGELMFSFANSTSGTYFSGDTVVYGTNGEMHVYILDNYNGWLAMWNSTKAFIDNGLISDFFGTFQHGMFMPFPGEYNWKAGIEWNTTIPILPLTPYTVNAIDDVLAVIYYDPFGSSGTGFSVYYHAAYSLDTGALLWEFDRSQTGSFLYSLAFGDGMYAQYDQQQSYWRAYDLNTGNEKWISDETVYPWGVYLGGADSGVIAYNKLYSTHFDGYLHAFDITTGEEVWKFGSEKTGLEDPYENYPMWFGPMIADGVVFAGTGDMMPQQPFVRGHKLFAVDAETGEEIWSISGMFATSAIVDGYLLCEGAYDNRIYCFGKGPSATTVSAPKLEVTLGQSVVIEGTVTDQTPSSKDTPAISDEDMGAWMEYLHMQKPIPSNAKGVDVSIDVIDVNGNYRNVGTATSNIAGKFSLVWEPDIYGEYTIFATFAGSESYGSSFDITTMFVEEAPQPTPPPEATPAPMTDTYLAGSTIAIIAAIGIAVFLILRKK